MKRIITIGLSLLLILTLLASCVSSFDQRTSAETLALGEQYLLDKNNEQAVICFNDVIEDEPQNERAYLGASEAYISMGETDKALAILKKGRSALPKSELIRQASDGLHMHLNPNTAPSPEVDSSVSVSQEPEEVVVKETPFVQINADGGLRMRKGPGTEYDIITLIPNQELVDIAESPQSSPNWIYVAYKNTYGWVNTEFVVYPAEGETKETISTKLYQSLYWGKGPDDFTLGGYDFYAPMSQVKASLSGMEIVETTEKEVDYYGDLTILTVANTGTFFKFSSDLEYYSGHKEPALVWFKTTSPDFIFCRNIKVGDTAESVVNKFPHDQDGVSTPNRPGETIIYSYLDETVNWIHDGKKYKTDTEEYLSFSQGMYEGDGGRSITLNISNGIVVSIELW